MADNENAALQAAGEIVNNDNAVDDANKILESSDSDSSEENDSSEDAPEISKKEKVEIKKRLKSLKLKVDGKEYNEELPFEIDDNPEIVEYMTRQLQMSKMSQKRAQEKSSLEKQVDQVINLLKTNPRKILTDPAIGIDLKKFAAEIMEEEIANSQKSPEQLEKEKLENELRTLKEQFEKDKEEQKSAELERLEHIETERYDIAMEKALSNSDLPKSPYVVKKMAEYMILGIKNGVDLSPEDVLPLVKEEIQSDLQQMFSAMPLETLEKLVGKDVFKKVRQNNIQKAKSAPSSKVSDTGTTKKTESKPAVKQTFKEFFKI